jgi:hypothetical protein
VLRLGCALAWERRAPERLCAMLMSDRHLAAPHRLLSHAAELPPSAADQILPRWTEHPVTAWRQDQVASHDGPDKAVGFGNVGHGPEAAVGVELNPVRQTAVVPSAYWRACPRCECTPLPYHRIGSSLINRCLTTLARVSDCESAHRRPTGWEASRSPNGEPSGEAARPLAARCGWLLSAPGRHHHKLWPHGLVWNGSPRSMACARKAVVAASSCSSSTKKRPGGDRRAAGLGGGRLNEPRMRPRQIRRDPTRPNHGRVHHEQPVLAPQVSHR